MTLLIDAGNTRVKIGWIDAATGRREAQPLALEHRALDQLPNWLQAQGHRPSRALGVSVAKPEVAARLDALLARHLKFGTRWVHSQAEAAGLRNGYKDPAQLGPDRWASMLGLAQHATNETPLLLATFGTATTIDTLRPVAPTDDDAAHFLFEGGLIFPGPALMLTSLASGTAKLPQAAGTVTAFPVDTHQAISSGIVAAQAGALLRQWRLALERYACPPQVFSAGGGWPMVEAEAQRMLAQAHADLNLAPQAIQWLPSPVLDGLARLALSER